MSSSTSTEDLFADCISEGSQLVIKMSSPPPTTPAPPQPAEPAANARTARRSKRALAAAVPAASQPALTVSANPPTLTPIVLLHSLPGLTAPANSPVPAALSNPPAPTAPKTATAISPAPIAPEPSCAGGDSAVPLPTGAAKRKLPPPPSSLPPDLPATADEPYMYTPAADAGAAGANPAPSGAARRARRAPPTTPDLPATAAEVTDSASLSRVVTLLSTSIVRAVHDGKSVTASNKRLIALAAEETRKAMAAFLLLAQSTQQPTCTATASTTTTEATTEATDDNGLAGMKRELLACVREEVGKLKAELSFGARPGRPAAATAAAATAAAVAASDADMHPPRSYAQALGKRPAHGPGVPPRAALPPPAPRVSKPAIIVATKEPTNIRQDVVYAWRKSISFKECRYAPVQVRPVSGNKLRVEFETSSQRDDTLKRLRESNQEQVSAELARGLHPMIAIKGVDKETPVEELTSVILHQNPALEGLCESDFTFKFKRINRNPNLYNAVFIVQPKLFKAITEMGRVCIDHQRVHVEEFSPFLQCFTCLQFGHVRKNCPSKTETCEFCAETGHDVAACTAKKTEGASPTCFNCTKRNSKFENSKTDTRHKATSASCPVLRAMKRRINYRIDYGSNP